METLRQNKLWILGGILGALVYRSQMSELDRISKPEFQHRINAAQLGCNNAANSYVIMHPDDASGIEQAIAPLCAALDELKQKYFDRFGLTYPA